MSGVRICSFSIRQFRLGLHLSLSRRETVSCRVARSALSVPSSRSSTRLTLGSITLNLCSPEGKWDFSEDNYLMLGDVGCIYISIDDEGLLRWCWSCY